MWTLVWRIIVDIETTLRNVGPAILPIAILTGAISLIGVGGSIMAVLVGDEWNGQRFAYGFPTALVGVLITWVLLTYLIRKVIQATFSK